MAVFAFTIDLKDLVSGPAKKIKDSLSGLGDKIKGLVQQVTGLNDKSFAAMTAGFGEVALAAEALAGAFSAVVLGGAAFAISASQAKTQMIALFDAMGEGKIRGEEVDDMLDGLQQKLGIAKDTMVPFTTEIMKMGITSKDAIASMTQAALAAKALAGGADSGASAFLALQTKVQTAAETTGKIKIASKALSSQFKEMGLNIDDVAASMGTTSAALAKGLKAGTVDATKFGNALTDAVTKKGAGPLEMMSLSIGNLGSLLKQYIGDLFEDLGPAIKPFLEQVKSLFGIFDSKTAPSGKALKAGIEGFFTRVFQVATKLVPMVKHFLLDMVIYSLKAYIFLKPLVRSFLDWLDGVRSNKTFMDMLHKALDGLAIVFKTMAIVVGATLAGFMALQVAVLALIGGIVLITGEIAAFVASTAKSLLDWVTGAAQAARDFIAGLVNGISSGAKQVVDSVTGLAGKAKDAFKSALGIHSPSSVMMELGGHVATGAAMGMQGGAPEVHAASGDLASAAAGGMKASPGGGSKGSTFGDITIQINAPSGVTGAQELTEAAVSQLFERLALSQGLA